VIRGVRGKPGRANGQQADQHAQINLVHMSGDNGLNVSECQGAICRLADRFKVPAGSFQYNNNMRNRNHACATYALVGHVYDSCCDALKCYATMCLAENMRDWKASEQGSPLEHVFQLVLFSAPTLSIAKHAAALHCLGRLLSQNVNISAALSSRCGNLLVLLAPSGRKHGKSRARPDHCHRPVELWRLSDFCASSGRSNSVPMADVLSNNHTPATPPRFRHR